VTEPVRALPLATEACLLLGWLYLRWLQSGCRRQRRLSVPPWLPSTGVLLGDGVLSKMATSMGTT
jgi:hypothetical protein